MWDKKDIDRQLGVPPMPQAYAPPPSRNNLCPCGSGMKYKRCCGKPKPGPTAAVVQDVPLADMPPQAQNDYLKGLARIVEGLLPPGPSAPLGRSLFTLILWGAPGEGPVYVTNAERDGLAWHLRKTAERVEEQMDGQGTFRLPPPTEPAVEALRHLYFASHNLRRRTRGEMVGEWTDEELAKDFDEALAEANSICGNVP